MAVTLHKNSKSLVVTSFPKCVFGLCVLFLLVLWWAVLFLEHEQELEAIDYIIFNSVCLIGMVIQKKKILSLDKQTNRAVLVVKSILGTKESSFFLKDIKSIEMVYGRGQYARGGAIYLIVNDQKEAIVDSDICFGNVKRNIQVKDEISQWL
jgi:hypothetical protein